VTSFKGHASGSTVKKACMTAIEDEDWHELQRVVESNLVTLPPTTLAVAEKWSKLPK
jgi:hypothetical protein